MKTIEIKLYKFSELSEDAKQKAIEKHYDINVDYDWWQNTYEDARQIGLKITSFDLDRNRNAKGEFLLSACEVAQNILNEHGESCETYKTAQSFMEDWQPVFNDYMNEESENYESRELEDEMQDLEDDFLKSLCEDYSIMLQNEYEYLCSDEVIIETIEANEYDFTEGGSRH
jgi:myo-inositol catabolism protein IolC